MGFLSRACLSLSSYVLVVRVLGVLKEKKKKKRKKKSSIQMCSLLPPLYAALAFVEVGPHITLPLPTSQ